MFKYLLFDAKPWLAYLLSALVLIGFAIKGFASTNYTDGISYLGAILPHQQLWLQVTFVLIAGIWLQSLFANPAFFDIKNQVFVFVFIFTLLLLPHTIPNLQMAFSLLILISIFSELFKIAKQSGTNIISFLNLGLKLGFAPLCFTPFLYLPIITFVWLIVLNEISAKKLGAIFLGYLLPFYFVISTHFLTNSLPLMQQLAAQNLHFYKFGFIASSSSQNIGMVSICILFGLGVFISAGKAGRNKLLARKITGLFGLTGVFLLSLVLIYFPYWQETILLLTPIAVIWIGKLFLGFERKWLIESFGWAILLLVLLSKLQFFV